MYYWRDMRVPILKAQKKTMHQAIYRNGEWENNLKKRVEKLNAEHM